MKLSNHILPDKVSVLGTEYKIRYTMSDDDPKMAGNDGYCEFYSHEIFINRKMFVPHGDDKLLLKNLDDYGRKVIRHEIIHAFIVESGLSECCKWALDEEMTDWMARQFPKMAECFSKAGV